MKCSQVRRILDTLSSPELGVEHSGLSEHIQACSSCAAEYERWAKMVAVLHSAPPVVAPEGLAQDILQLAAQEDLSTGQSGKAQWALWPKLGLAGGLAAIAVIVSLSIYPQLIPQQPRTDRFTFRASFPNASSVSLVGDFNKWNTQHHALARREDGAWEISVAIAPGSYQYMFLVDGEKWCADPVNPVQIPDGFGGYNSGLQL